MYPSWEVIKLNLLLCPKGSNSLGFGCIFHGWRWTALNKNLSNNSYCYFTRGWLRCPTAYVIGGTERPCFYRRYGKTTSWVEKRERDRSHITSTLWGRVGVGGCANLLTLVILSIGNNSNIDDEGGGGSEMAFFCWRNMWTVSKPFLCSPWPKERVYIWLGKKKNINWG